MSHTGTHTCRHAHICPLLFFAVALFLSICPASCMCMCACVCIDDRCIGCLVYYVCIEVWRDGGETVRFQRVLIIFKLPAKALIRICRSPNTHTQTHPLSVFREKMTRALYCLFLSRTHLLHCLPLTLSPELDTNKHRIRQMWLSRFRPGTLVASGLAD